jgi:hypothetical protein
LSARTESLLLLISLTQNNADIQKIVAFEGAFDKLFRIVDAEGGIASGGIVVQDSLSAIVGLLRYNVSNQVRAVWPALRRGWSN